jgi:PTH1 family peptidyl-tRNA hydrolase
MIRLFVGLGNPGAEYEATRHNAGFWWVDALAAKLGLRLCPSAATTAAGPREQARWRAALAARADDLHEPLGPVSVAALARFFKIEPEADPRRARRARSAARPGQAEVSAAARPATTA